ncbi:MAG: hypothetical protein DHS20C01_32210 [marine bacterium B5-7]|nr:MAG: hypothetical protein DHS20C01_32210 [marine bacterium B5-7]
MHTWLAVKDIDAPEYEIYEVLGWRGWRGASVVSKSRRTPDTYWYGSRPWLLLDVRGDEASRLIPSIRSAVNEYPFADRYEIWPGPNSNTFTAFIVRSVEGLNVQLPVTAVGKDYLPSGVFARTPSGSGFQLSFHGVFGITLALDEGLEFNLLGLSFGIDFLHPALKLPGIGRIGFASITIAPTPAA